MPDSHAEKLSNEIKKQGDKVKRIEEITSRQSIIDVEIKKLLTLKGDYKSITGQDWKQSSTSTSKTPSKACDNVINKMTDHEIIAEEVQKQGDKIRQLKATKAEKPIIDQEVKLLLTLKADYKTATGKDWKPFTTPVANASNKEETRVNQILESIQKQEDKVRQLNESKAEKNIIDQEVKILFDLKNDYKTLTGQEWKSVKPDTSTKKKKQENISKTEKQKGTPNKEISKSESTKDTDTSKTGTRLGLEVKKAENFFEWYSQLITKSGMIEYYDVSGCYIFRPWSFSFDRHSSTPSLSHSFHSHTQTSTHTTNHLLFHLLTHHLLILVHSLHNYRKRLHLYFLTHTITHHTRKSVNTKENYSLKKKKD